MIKKVTKEFAVMLLMGIVCVVLSETVVPQQSNKKATENFTIEEQTTNLVKSPFSNENGKLRYYKDGQAHIGFLNLDGKIYFFNKKGNMHFGVLEHGDSVYYFDEEGVMQKGTFTVENVQYKANETTGRIYSINNITKAICQMPEMPTGCEITAWTMMANYAGVEITKFEAADIMPRSDNPNLGFGGTPYSYNGTTMVIYPGGLSGMTEEYLGSFVDMTGCSITDIKAKLREKHLIIVWMANLNGFPTHAVALTGYDEAGLFYNNPWTGEKEKITYSEFLEKWEEKQCRAMSY